ncbi:hypothetical protein NKH72_13510 [Mesorhizobium sp. M0955]|uniref:hypothetical protein n=1 Tax=Mesorhizobium sp. M0955 TaxID=2957033 RepID=UPI003338A6B0
MKAFHGSPCLFDRFDAAKLGVRRPGSEGHGVYLAAQRNVAAAYGGYCYEVSIPEGVYLDNDSLCEHQSEPARTLLLEALSRQKGYNRFRLDNAANQDIYTQVGQLLVCCRKDGVPLEPVLIAAGYVGCKRQNPGWLEFVVFDPAHLRIVSVSTPLKRAA